MSVCAHVRSRGLNLHRVAKKIFARVFVSSVEPTTLGVKENEMKTQWREA